MTDASAMKNGSNKLGFAALLLGLSLVGCGGSDGGSCGQAKACGGNIVGNWKVVSSCLTGPSGAATGCAGASTDVSNMRFDGQVDFNADMTESGSLSLSGSFVSTFPASCFNNQTIACDLLGPATQAALGPEQAAQYQSVTCATAGSGCACIFVLTPMSTTITGTTYTTSGSTLTETDAAGPNDSGYCVQGSTLTLLPNAPASTGMGSAMGGFGGALILMKQ